MDCPAEEQLIRLQLQKVERIIKLEFDLQKRELIVFHSGPIDQIDAALQMLNLGSRIKETTPTQLEDLPDQLSQRKVLLIVLMINFSFFLIEFVTGLVSNSMGLIADSLDMLADAFVYGISLLAVGATLVRKKHVAGIAGYFQLALAVIGIIEVIRRFVGLSSLPDFTTMILVSILALVANGFCLFLLQKSSTKEAHIQASLIFTSNDIIINIGVIAAGLLVFWTGSKMPDLVVGIIVFVLVIYGAMRILKLSK